MTDLRKMTVKEKVEICEIIKKINAVVEHDDPHLMLQALSFYMLGAVEITYKMSKRDSVDFCADCFKRYGQFVMS